MPCDRMVALLCEGETNDRELRGVIFLLLVDAEKAEDEEFERQSYVWRQERYENKM